MRERTHKEIIEMLNFMDMYDVAWIIENQKKQITSLKGQNTKLKKRLAAMDKTP